MEEIATYESVPVPMISDDSLVHLAETAEKRIEAVNKIKKLALRVTNSRDWVDQSGKPYLQASGSEKVARLFGISWRLDEPVYESEEGGHYSYTYKGHFTLSGTTIEAIGSRSTKDKFFTKYDYVNGKKVALPMTEIDRGDIKKAAYTNCIGRGISGLLGLKNLTWEELTESGISKDAAGRVEYKKDGKATEEISSEEAVTVTAVVTDVRKKTGTTNGKPWTSYIIKTADAEYKTFSESIAKFAMEAKQYKHPIAIIYKPTKFGNDIEDMRLTTPQTEEAAQE